MISFCLLGYKDAKNKIFTKEKIYKEKTIFAPIREAYNPIKINKMKVNHNYEYHIQYMNN